MPRRSSAGYPRMRCGRCSMPTRTGTALPLDVPVRGPVPTERIRALGERIRALGESGYARWVSGYARWVSGYARWVCDTVCDVRTGHVPVRRCQIDVADMACGWVYQIQGGMEAGAFPAVHGQLRPPNSHTSNRLSGTQRTGNGFDFAVHAVPDSGRRVHGDLLRLCPVLMERTRVR
eukprot:1416881-Rhodomonas_salina.5